MTNQCMPLVLTLQSQVFLTVHFVLMHAAVLLSHSGPKLTFCMFALLVFCLNALYQWFLCSYAPLALLFALLLLLQIRTQPYLDYYLSQCTKRFSAPAGHDQWVFVSCSELSHARLSVSDKNEASMPPPPGIQDDCAYAVLGEQPQRKPLLMQQVRQS
jgi:hypothetical protein